MSISFSRWPNEKSLKDEEELIRLLAFAPLERIVAFIFSKVDMDLHYPTWRLKTPLTAAIERGIPSILETLIDKYPVSLDSTTTQPFMKTALMHAAYTTKHTNVLRVLIERGSDVHKTDMRGWNCLYYAVIGERIENVRCLLESGVDIESRDIQGRTLLMISVILSNVGISRLLLDNGANAAATDNFEYDALRLAVLRTKREHAVLLVESGISNLTSIPPTSTYSNYELIEHLMPELIPDIVTVKTKAEED